VLLRFYLPSLFLSLPISSRKPICIAELFAKFWLLVSQGCDKADDADPIANDPASCFTAAITAQLSQLSSLGNTQNPLSLPLGVADSPPQVSSLASHPAAASAVTAHLAHAPAAPALSTALETGALANAGLHPMHALLALMQSPGKLVNHSRTRFTRSFLHVCHTRGRVSVCVSRCAIAFLQVQLAGHMATQARTARARRTDRRIDR
jgi:hypothetical protein